MNIVKQCIARDVSCVATIKYPLFFEKLFTQEIATDLGDLRKQ